MKQSLQAEIRWPRRVVTPADAVRCYLDTRLDALVMEDFVAVKEAGDGHA